MSDWRVGTALSGSAVDFTGFTVRSLRTQPLLRRGLVFGAATPHRHPSAAITRILMHTKPSSRPIHLGTASKYAQSRFAGTPRGTGQVQVANLVDLVDFLAGYFECSSLSGFDFLPASSEKLAPHRRQLSLGSHVISGALGIEIIRQRQRGQRKKYCPMPMPTAQANITGRTISLSRNTDPTKIHVAPPTNRKIQNLVTTLIYAALSPSAHWPPKPLFQSPKTSVFDIPKF